MKVGLGISAEKAESTLGYFKSMTNVGR